MEIKYLEFVTFNIDIKDSKGHSTRTSIQLCCSFLFAGLYNTERNFKVQKSGKNNRC